MKISNEIPFKMWRINENGVAINVTDNKSINTIDPCNAPRQLLPTTYYQDGYVDVFPISTILNFGNTTGDKVLPFIVDEFSHDIDTFDDLKTILEKFLNPEDDIEDNVPVVANTVADSAEPSDLPWEKPEAKPYTLENVAPKATNTDKFDELF
jgi:hypothetical protein